MGSVTDDHGRRDAGHGDHEPRSGEPPSRGGPSGRPEHRGSALSLAALALGGFAIGTSEFASMGVLPGYAGELGVSVPAAGTAITAYALGVVVGAPVITLVAARWRRRRLAVVLAAAVAATSLLSAIAPSFPAFVAARFLAGLPHGAYFGTVAVLAGALVPPERRARALATSMSGLMLANVLGVPVATWLGGSLGWRSAYLAVVVVAGATVVAVALLVPDVDTGGGGSLRGELSALRRAQVWLMVTVIAVGFGGTFAVYSYVSPILTEVSHVPRGDVPWILAVFGTGATVGNWVGGRLAARRPLATIAAAMVAGAAVLAALGLTAGSPVAVTLNLFLLGGVIITATPAMTARLIDAAAEGPTLAAASYHSAFNVANALGASLGGAVLAAGLGYRAPPLVGAALPVLGLGVLAVSAARQRRRGDLG